MNEVEAQELAGEAIAAAWKLARELLKEQAINACLRDENHNLLMELHDPESEAGKWYTSELTRVKRERDAAVQLSIELRDARSVVLKSIAKRDEAQELAGEAWEAGCRLAREVAGWMGTMATLSRERYTAIVERDEARRQRDQAVKAVMKNMNELYQIRADDLSASLSAAIEEIVRVAEIRDRFRKERDEAREEVKRLRQEVKDTKVLHRASLGEEGDREP